MQTRPPAGRTVLAVIAAVVLTGAALSAAAPGAPQSIVNGASADQPARRLDVSPLPSATAPPATVSPTPSPTPAPGPAPTYRAWFSGRRDVRFGSPVTDQWVVKTFYSGLGGFSCSGQAFGVNYDVAPGQGKECQYASVYQTTTLPAPAMAMGPAVDRTQTPLGHPGVGVQLITSTGVDASPAEDGVGAFRIICDYSHMNYDDPIVYPGEVGRAHLHTFFANTGTNAASTANSLTTTGGSTCFGGTVNRSAYWVPTAIDARTGAPMAPTHGIFYYKSGYGGVKPLAIKAMPAGLRMIAGNGAATTAAQASEHGGWSCGGPRTSSIPACPAGGELRLIIEFPQCWNGRDLDAPDHKSHMAYTIGETGCPSTHPVAIPVITFNIIWLIGPGDDTSQWRLSSDMYTGGSGGYSFHGDWFNGWDEGVESRWILNCVQLARNCSDTLGNGELLEILPTLSS
jgi:hypothetical protein